MNLRFPGQYYDQETELHYNYFRDYNPKTGRYIQSDPIGINGGINTFTYVAANPLSLTDSTGLALDTVTSWCRQHLAACVELGLLGSAGLAASTSTNQQLGPILTDCVSAIVAVSLDLVSPSTSKCNKNKGGSNATKNPAVAATGGMPTPPPDDDKSRKEKPLQTGGHTLNNNTANQLNQNFGTSYHKRDWGRALEDLKKDYGLRNDH